MSIPFPNLWICHVIPHDKNTLSFPLTPPKSRSFFKNYVNLSSCVGIGWPSRLIVAQIRSMLCNCVIFPSG